MEKLHKLSEWRPDMPKRITGLTTEELEKLEKITDDYSYDGPSPCNLWADSIHEKIKAEIERRKNGE